METISNYKTLFWNAMRCNQEALAEISQIPHSAEGNIVPDDFNKGFTAALEKENLFRRYGTVINTTTSKSRIQAVSSTGTAEWLDELATISESADTFIQFLVNSYKLASMSKINSAFISDLGFNLENYLLNEFARRFGRSEEDAFINGDGVDAPCGILNTTKGGQIGVTAADTSTVNYDEIIGLYFSLKPEHRKNAVWLMNDETAFVLRTLKDNSGNYLWNNADNTILGKPVEYSMYMPNIESGKIPLAFGDLSYYWIIQRKPLAIKLLTEKYCLQGYVGFYGHERLDGKLILPEAVKLLKMA